MKKLLAQIIEENKLFAQRLQEALLRAARYETRAFASEAAYQNYHRNRIDASIDGAYPVTGLNRGERITNTSKLLKLTDRYLSNPIAAYEYVLKDEFSVKKMERMTGGYATIEKVKEENRVFNKGVKMEKALIVWTSAIIISLFYATFLMQ